MLSMPTSFADFYVKCLKMLPYIAVLNGMIFSIVGLYFIYSSSAFSARSVVEEVHVVSMESRRSDNGIVYRPLFKALQNDGTSITYSGSAWVSPKPHNDGDIVDGRVDWEAGEIRSVSMMKFYTSMGKVFSVLGGICFFIGALYLWRKRTRSQVT
ncbi:hypothetical protein RCCS2_08394 [Roseobacter sp. CCS2]|nr:hypothetical protein RCCS2_08394 [Roseobacter sp. CCS2]